METPASTASKGPKSMQTWIIAAIVVIGIILVLLNTNKQAESGLDESKSDTALEATYAGDQAATLVVSADPDQALVYTAAMTKYAGSRIEFDTRCNVKPLSLTLKSGTKLMLDNRGSVINRVIVGEKMFQIPAYNFAFITLESKSPSTTYAVSCGEKRNVASVLVTH